MFSIQANIERIPNAYQITLSQLASPGFDYAKQLVDWHGSPSVELGGTLTAVLQGIVTTATVAQLSRRVPADLPVKVVFPDALYYGHDGAAAFVQAWRILATQRIHAAFTELAGRGVVSGLYTAPVLEGIHAPSQEQIALPLAAWQS